MNPYGSYPILLVSVGAILLVAILGLITSAVMPGMDKWSKRFFVCFFAILSLCVSLLFVDYAAYGVPEMSSLVKATSFVESLLLGVLVALPAAYLVHCCGERLLGSVLFRAVIVLGVAFVVLLTVAQYSSLFYYYTPDNLFGFGPWYPLLVAPMAATLVLSLVTLVRKRALISKRRFVAFLSFLIPLSATTVMHMFETGFLFMYVGMTISALALLVTVVSDQIGQYLLLQEETTRQRAKIAVLQMRPHFIHNTMTSIYYLCDEDPKVAQQVTMDFNTYLRKNFKAMVKDGPIAFAEELEHTRAYLAVEQAQLTGKLVVIFDVPHTEFCVPPLTLQPLAENAVKHGIGPKTVPLRVTIRSRKVGSASEIVVEDNGPGFDPSVADNPRTTLANIRQRLEMMCAGKLEFERREGGGTLARVTIPGQAGEASAPRT